MQQDPHLRTRAEALACPLQVEKPIELPYTGETLHPLFRLQHPFFVAFIVEEKQCGMKGQLLVSGLRGINYWVANYIFDLVPWSVALGLVTLTFWAYDLELYLDPQVFRLFVTAMVGFMAHIIPFAYCLAQLFREPSSAIISVLFFGFFFVFFYILWVIFLNEEGLNGDCGPA